MEWFLYDKELRHERVKTYKASLSHFMPLVSLYSLKTENLWFSGVIERDQLYEIG